MYPANPLSWLAVSDVKRERARLVKGAGGVKSQKVQQFLAQLFQPPSGSRKRKATCTNEMLLTSHADDHGNKRVQFDLEVSELTRQKLVDDCVAAERQVLVLTKRVAALEKENCSLRKQNQGLREKPTVYCPRRAKQALKRKNKSISLWKEKYNKLSGKATKIKGLEKIVSEAKTQQRPMLNQKRRRLYRKRKSASSFTARQSQHCKCSVHADAMKQLAARLSESKKDGLCWENELRSLQEAQQSSPVKTMDGGSFTSQVRAIGQQRQQRHIDALREKFRLRREQRDARDHRKREGTEKKVEDLLDIGLWEPSEIEIKLEGLSMTKSRSLLRKQIMVQRELVGRRVEDKIAVSKASVEQLVDYLTKLLRCPLSEQGLFIDPVLREPLKLINRHISHVWEDDSGEEVWYRGHISGYVDGEFQLDFDGESSTFMTTSEVLTDLINGDLHCE